MNNFHSFEAETIFSSINPFLIYIPFLLWVFGIIIFFIILKKLLQILTTLKQEQVFLELTPPAFTEKTAYTTQQLFSVLHSIGSQQSLLDRIMGRKKLFSLEIVSTQKKGIRYLLRAPKKDANNIKRSVLSYLPYIQFHVTSDYLLNKVSNGSITEFDLSKHYAFPLKTQDMLYEHDPVAYITGMMTKLEKNELISFQVIISPVNKNETRKLSKMILRNEDILQYLDKPQLPRAFAPLQPLNTLIVFIGLQLQWAIAELTKDTRQRISSNTSFYHSQPNLAKPARVLSSFEEESVKSIQSKIDQSLFETTIRVFVKMNDESERHERINGFVSSLAIYSVPKYQEIRKKSRLMLRLTDRIRCLTFAKRTLSLITNSSSSILSVSEVADLYHFPYTKTTQTENIVKVHSKELPAPLTLKNDAKLDVIFAKNMYGGTETPIGLTVEERMRHMYVIGATGTGKTTMLTSMIFQDIQNGKGVCVVDPHGDLAESLINTIPEDRVKDFIYFNPYDIKFPIGINLLELTPGLEEDEALLEKEFIAESVISLFRKVFSDAMASHPHRIEYILRNTIHTAFTLENPTLFTIFELLNNPPFQKKAIQGLKDENLKNFWKYEFGKAGDFQKVKMVAPVTARIGRFLFSPSAKRILEQEKSTINFDEILDTKKILICNLSKGNLGEDTSEVMGIMLLNKIQLAILKRARVEKKKRNNFYLYVDEFQNFATPSFVQMLSESRKYGLSLTMAEQSTSQQKDKTLVQIVLANAGTVVTFRSANPQDELLLLPQYRPYLSEGDIANLPSFHFYMKTSAITPEEPFSGVTTPVEINQDKEYMKKLIQSSRNLYAKEYTLKKVQTENSKKLSTPKAKQAVVKSGLPT